MNPRLNTDVNNNGTEKKKSFTFADLPTSILELIMVYLVLKDNIRASAVCKAWREAAELVRVVGKHPWVITLPKYGGFIDLIDPLQRKLYSLYFPRKLARTKVCYSKDGWLLLRQRSSFADMFFFNPFTREIKSLPSCKFYFQAVAFSSAPTSGTCTVIVLNPLTRRISIFYPGATEWNYMDISGPHGFCPNEHSNIVYANGHFYCFYLIGGLLDFDVSSRTVSFQLWDEHRIPYFHNNELMSHRRIIYLMEQRGVFFVMYTCGTAAPLVYKIVSSKWEEMTGTTLDGLAIFASLQSSETRVNIPGMGNSVNFSKYSLRAERCLSYSFDKGRYYPRKRLPIPKNPSKSFQCPRRSIWIEPPSEKVLDLMCKAKQRDVLQGILIAI
ncbi:F-box protein [Cardamine amara subsp. amara]|uniref:F-box protein n=1 Tax=Cardamine amara subsp. amara TaxID=228776 RepID=A0ABD0Z848_CARAN